MSQNTRVKALFKLVFIVYLVVLATITLFPDVNNITYEISTNLLPLNSIDNFFSDMLTNGFINWNAFMVRPINPSEIFFNGFTNSFKNLAGNIIIFIPFGLFYPLMLKEKKTFAHIFVVILGTTCLIELIQFLFLSSRRADIDDIILNLIGGLLGYAIFKWLKVDSPGANSLNAGS